MNRFQSRLLVLGSTLVASCSNLWAASLRFGDLPQTGTISAAAQSNSYTFGANAKDVVDFTMVVTGGKLVPKIRIYNPDGTQLTFNYSGNPFGCSGSTLELNTVALPAAGTYTVLVADCGDTNTGSYLIYSQRTNNPTAAAVLLFGGQPQAGTIGSAAWSSSYVFSGSAKDVVNLTMVVTSGNLVPKIRVYNPDGAQLAFN